MLKLYKRINDIMYYHEAWGDEDNIIVHWGKVGEYGQAVEHKRIKNLSEEKNIENLLTEAIENGFVPIELDDHSVLIIEYPFNTKVSASLNLDKRCAVENRMNQILGWTGLGNCDGGSMGSGTIDICCFVVDFNIARQLIEEDLKDSEFSDYSRIYNPQEV